MMLAAVIINSVLTGGLPCFGGPQVLSAHIRITAMSPIHAPKSVEGDARRWRVGRVDGRYGRWSYSPNKGAHFP